MVKYDLMCEVGRVGMRVCASRRIQSKKIKKKSPRGGPIIDPAWAWHGHVKEGRKEGGGR